jgi:hypothetical protein
MTYIEEIDARFADDDKIYYFKWAYGTSPYMDGFHGTEKEFEAKKVLNTAIINKYGPPNLISKRFCFTGKEYKAYANLPWKEKMNRQNGIPLTNN